MAQIEINDLVGKAVNNAIERREKGMAGLSDLPAQESNSITGGSLLGLQGPIIAGMISPIKYLNIPRLTIGNTTLV